MELTNRNFNVVFSPKDKTLYANRRRILISCNQIQNYIGFDNYLAVLKRFDKCLQDKCTVKFRKLGKIEIYSK